jgi:cation diffusion facilitator family transporter
MIRDPRRTVIHISLAASLLMLTGKTTAWMLTHSTALLADAAESVVHGAATGLAAFSLWLAARPADKHHPYGHGRIAYFSAGFEGALVLAAAGAVVWSGVDGLLHPPALTRLGTGLAIATGLALVNLVLGLALIRIGRKHNALILVANGQHVLSDVWTTAAAIVGVVLVMVTGVKWLDPVSALAIAGIIMFNGGSLVFRSVGGLMDRVDPDLSRDLVHQLDEAVNQDAIRAYHQLRCRLINDELWVEVHLLLPGEHKVIDAHAAVTRVEESIAGRFPAYRVHVTSHIEPAEHEIGHPTGHPEENEPFAAEPKNKPRSYKSRDP